MGWRHGLYCVGCCWALMVLLFVTGVMNLLWISLISVFVLAEKALPAGQLVARASGIALIVTALWMFFRGVLTVPGA
jgi:predicted metal-binding membrane protein